MRSLLFAFIFFAPLSARRYIDKQEFDDQCSVERGFKCCLYNWIVETSGVEMRKTLFNQRDLSRANSHEG